MKKIPTYLFLCIFFFFPFFAQATLPLGVPPVLNSQDIRLYKRVFALQDIARWSQANRLLKRVKNDILRGHVLYQRFMHPLYRSHYRELQKWLTEYARTAEAPAIYKLALKKRPRHGSYPHKPYRPSIPSLSLRQARATDDDAPDLHPRDYPSPSLWPPRLNRSARHLTYHVFRLVRHGHMKSALKLLSSSSTRRHIGTFGYGRSMSRILFGYLRAHKDEKNLEAFHKVPPRVVRHVPKTAWFAGLAAWRLQKFSQATVSFEEAAKSRWATHGQASAGFFWAARASLRSGQFARVTSLLRRAAHYPYTFYGLLAARALGLKPKFDWSLPRLTQDRVQMLIKIPSIQRAIALIQVDRFMLAEQELARLERVTPSSLVDDVLSFSSAVKFANTTYKVGIKLSHKGEFFDAALYPFPHWEPSRGFLLDRAIIYGFMRRESLFHPKALSHVGARGLMQLMPATASVLSGSSFHGRNKNKLYDPNLNLSLGQKYLRQMLNNPDFDRNLFFVTAGYNAGKGNVDKWRKRNVYNNDPLLFIELIPFKETRTFVKRVVKNIWIYRYRLGENPQSMDDVISGQWPLYRGKGVVQKFVVGEGRQERGLS